MKEILIKATTAEGKAALKQHWKESKKLPLRQRLALKASGYKHQLVSEDPMVILVTMNNRYANNPLFLDLIKGEITKALKSNGATKDDYVLEVKS